MIDEHAEAVEDGAAFGFGCFDEFGSRRVGDDVGDDHVGLEGVGVEVERGVGVGVEADGGGVDDDVGAIGNGVVCGPFDERGGGWCFAV